MTGDPIRPYGGAGLPRVAHEGSATAVRALVLMIPGAIARAEALGANDVADHLRMALLVSDLLLVPVQPRSLDVWAFQDIAA